MNFWDVVGDLGEDILEAGGDIISGIGDNYENRVEYESAVIERMKVNNRLALQSYKDDSRRKDEAIGFVKNVTMLSLVVLLGLLAYAKTKK